MILWCQSLRFWGLFLVMWITDYPTGFFPRINSWVGVVGGLPRINPWVGEVLGRWKANTPTFTTGQPHRAAPTHPHDHTSHPFFLIWGAQPNGLRSYPLNLPGNSGEENEHLRQTCLAASPRCTKVLHRRTPRLVISHE